jgi:predicted tellurium resistance membrane protein TerC
MRFAAKAFIRLMEVFPKLEHTAYLFVGIIGAKLCVDGLQLAHVDFHSYDNPAFWIFWVAIGLGCGVRFTSNKREKVSNKK